MPLIAKHLRNKAAGFAMIEVLVTAIIFAIGISGMGVLLLKTVQGTQDNAQRSQGMWIVEDFIGRLRSNPEAAKAGNYETTGADCDAADPTPMCADHIKSGAEVKGVDCTPGEMAVFDIRITTCGFDDFDPEDDKPEDKVFDTPAEFLVSPVLTATCNPANTYPCTQYLVNLSWTSKIAKGSTDAGERNTVNNYSMVVELN